MSMFSCLCAERVLWDPTSIAMWGSLDFCPPIQQLSVHTIKQTQLTTLSQAGAWGNTKKSRKDVAFLLIAPSLAIGCERIFGLVAVWAYPCQVCA